jgi:GR25 family glycosyltransferase involved in LPS biosynthesis
MSNSNNLNLFFSRNCQVESAYIITVKGNEASEKYSKRCQLSCMNVGMPVKIWDAFDGIEAPIKIPDHSIGESVTRMLKVTDHYLTRGEVACALSHISLWVHCAKIDQPIVILEHDSVMVKKFDSFPAFNSIMYLGGKEWAEDGWQPVPGIPPHASEGPNYHFICRAHAYAIDPVMAKNLISHVLTNGICRPLDIIMRADLFNITHQGMHAYDKNAKDNYLFDTTIKSRPITGRTTERNDKLIN